MGNLTDRLYEQVLVLRCQTGDPAAFEELFERYEQRLRYFVLKLSREPGHVDDVLQDVWCDVYRKLARLKDPAAFGAWVYRIARDHVRRRLRGTAHEPQPLAGADPPAPADSSAEPVFAAEEAALIHAALDQLSDEHREVLLLRFVEDMNYDEIAGVVGCPLGTVRSRIHHAKLQLRRLLERNDHHDR